MCKILLQSVKYLLNQSIANFGRIFNLIKILLVGRVPGISRIQGISRQIADPICMDYSTDCAQKGQTVLFSITVYILYYLHKLHTSLSICKGSHIFCYEL